MLRVSGGAVFVGTVRWVGRMRLGNLAKFHGCSQQAGGRTRCTPAGERVMRSCVCIGNRSGPSSNLETAFLLTGEPSTNARMYVANIV